MPPKAARARVSRALLALCAVLLPSLASCGGPHERPLLPRSQTWAELRTIRRAVTVKPPEESERPPHPRERLVDGEAVHVAAEGLAWLRRDGGATLLVRGPAELTLRSGAVELTEGRVFVDTPSGHATELETPSGPLHLAHVRASIDVTRAGTEVYVLAGEVRTDGAAHAGPGERLVITGTGKSAKAVNAPVLVWDDWTGGLATTDRAAEPSPYGVGTVGARKPGDVGSPQFPLAIQRLGVHVTIEQDFAVTEVDEVFFNPSSEVVEGVYRFRTPEGASLHRFGVDRDGAIKWGRVKEKAAAAAQYQANVYQGSTEDPALLEWDAPGVYRARLYPIGPGETRRVVVTYAEWLGRTGRKHERRLYVYPMAADGAEESLPHIEELYATIDLARAGARDVRAGMAGVRDGDTLVVREHDLVPRADLAVELFDDGHDGPAVWRGYQAPHTVDVDALPPTERPEAMRKARTEADYVLVPVWDGDQAEARESAPGGLDLAIVVDTSAATETAALAVARAATGALLAHLGKSDRAVVWAGDASLRPVVPSRDKLAALDDAARRDVLARLATIERGGATDLGAMLAAAAASLDPSPARRGAVVYIGDGASTVGELGLGDLRDRLSKLPRPVRIFGLGVGDSADMAILKGLSRGAFAERIGDANAAARAALRLLEVAERPARLGASVDLGPTVERIFPRDLGAVVEGEGQVVIGRLTGIPPASMTVKTAAGEQKVAIKINAIEDRGDLRRRWAEGRLAQMIDEGVGRAAMVDLGSRSGIITPVTSLYVPTKNEMTSEERTELEAARRTRRRAPPRKMPSKYDRSEGDAEKASDRWGRDDAQADNKEGGTGTRAKGEEGSMGNPGPRPSGNRYGVQGPSTGHAEAVTVTASPSPAAAPAQAAPSAMATASVAFEPPPPPGVPAPNGESPRRRPSAPADAPAGFGGGRGRLGGAHVDQTVLAKSAADKPAEAGGPKARTIVDVAGSTNQDGRFPANDPYQVDGVPAAGGAKDGDLGVAGGLIGGENTVADALSQRLVTRDEASKQVVLEQKNVAFRSTTPAYWSEITVRLGDVPHVSSRCGNASNQPLEERAVLWRERLARAAGNASAVASVYRRALAWCEAPTWRERSRLLSMLLDAMPSIQGKVALWRVMFNDLGAADALYRGLLSRVRTPEEVRTLHDALGLKSVDPGLLAKMLKDAKTPGERVTKLRALWATWSDDFALALRLLDALEDAGDDPGARELGRKLRARPDADARVRTAVGELYLRIAARAADPAQRALDEGEARRAFGEIVEFAPDDPIARRRIGDLLRTHGWYAEAARQYETLARLAPDDAAVALLLASAAQGLGKLEEAVKWTEKGGASGAPDADQSPAHTARAFAATWLSWGRMEALAQNHADEAKALATRLARVRSTERASSEALRGARASLIWSHPELHPTLWTNALGAPMPAPEGDVTLGIAAATVPAREGAFLEVRVEPDEVEHAARLGASAVLTVVFDEGGAGEKIVKTKVTFARGGPATKRFALGGSDVKEVTP
jgi:Ca-activated chloride channel family protein